MGGRFFFRFSSLCLLLSGLLFCSGRMVEETKDGSRTIPSTGSLNSKAAASQRQLIRNDLESINRMPQFDVVTPTTTVPIINPTNPTTTTPIVNPTPAYPTSPTTMNPITNPTTPAYPTSPTTMNPITNPTTPAYPTSPTTTTPITNPNQPPSTASPMSGQSWCIASSTASQTALQVALDYACGFGGADCSAIQQGGSCYNPDTIRDHASYAFNQYYQKNPVSTSCDFGGTAMVTNTDPSSTTCQYPSSSTGSTVPNTSNPSGSTGFGSEPPSFGGTASILQRIPVLIPLICIIISSL